MTKLAEQVGEIDHEIEIGRSNQEHKVALDTYAAILNISIQTLDDIQKAIQQRGVLNAQLSIKEAPGFAGEEFKKRQTALTCLNELEAAWQESDYKVKQSGEFSKFTTAIKNYGDTLAQHTLKMFETWVEDADSQISVPQAILDLQRNLPGLRELVTIYDREYANFKAWSRRIPGAVEAQQLLATIKEIKTVTSKMDPDVPEPVKQFFDALQNASGTSGAPLRLLTDDVVKWLGDHGQTENYVIRRKGHSSW